MSIIHRIKCGNVNCHIIENGISGILVDTGRRKYAERVIEACKAYHVKLLVLTHGHFDHAENAAQIANTLCIPIGMSEKDCDLIKSNENQVLSAKTFLGKIVLAASLKDFKTHAVQEFKPDILLKNGNSLLDYGVNASIIALPGHTEGSIGVDVDGRHLIVGDALMNMFYPTVSMLYHDRKSMLESAEKISGLGSRTIHFGHGGPKANRGWVR